MGKGKEGEEKRGIEKREKEKKKTVRGGLVATIGGDSEGDDLQFARP